MEPLLFVMAILGCGENDAPCVELRRVEARYESREACLRATSTELPRHNDLPYPVIVADCRRGDATPRTMRGSEIG